MEIADSGAHCMLTKTDKDRGWPRVGQSRMAALCVIKLIEIADDRALKIIKSVRF
jgi:hypothetical protein